MNVMTKYLILALLGCTACGSQRSTECSTVFAGDQIRKFTTDKPGEFVSLPREGQFFQVVPDQSAGEYFIELVVGGKNVFVVADTGSSNVIIDPKDFQADAS